MKKRTFLYVVLEGFLNRESWAEQSLREASLAAGGSSVDNNTSRNIAAHQRRQDLKALCKDFYNKASTYMASIVKVFNE
jgi:hypothetical protein